MISSGISIPIIATSAQHMRKSNGKRIVSREAQIKRAEEKNHIDKGIEMKRQKEKDDTNVQLDALAQEGYTTWSARAKKATDDWAIRIIDDQKWIMDA